VLVTVGTNDTRVEWWGPVKYAWRLRAHQQAANNPILLSWTFEGHHANHPNQVALERTFLLQHLLAMDGSSEAKEGSAGAAA
jgi:protease II